MTPAVPDRNIQEDIFCRILQAGQWLRPARLTRDAGIVVVTRSNRGMSIVRFTFRTPAGRRNEDHYACRSRL